MTVLARITSVIKELNGTNIEIHYLDANFPFINKFPLLPHLSHNDGKKIDITDYDELFEQIENNVKISFRSSIRPRITLNPNDNMYHFQNVNAYTIDDDYFDLLSYYRLKKIKKLLTYLSKQNGKRKDKSINGERK